MEIVTTASEEQKPDSKATPVSDTRDGSRSKLRPGRGRRNGQGRGRRNRNNPQGRGPAQSKGSRPSGGENRSRSREERKEGRGGRNRRPADQGGNRSRRGGRRSGPKGADRIKQREALAPDPDYAEPTAVFIHQSTRYAVSREPDYGMGQRPHWFVRWEDDFDQGHDYDR